ncbi:MAG: TVP38/TMEM64 family protein [Thermoanaerobaculia bacterium]
MRLPRPSPRILLTVAVIALVVAVEWRFRILSPLARALDPARLESRLGDAGPLAPLLFVAVMALAVVSPLPTIPLDLLAGRLFGPLPGTLYSVVGATLGSLVSFQLARWLGRDFVARFLKGHIHFCQRCSDRLLSKIVFLGRLLPIAPFDLLSYGAGLTRMSASKFAAASFLGMLPLTFAYNTAGDLVLSSRWVGWVGGGLMLVLFFLLPWWIERYDLFSMRQYFRHEKPATSPAAGRHAGEGPPAEARR